MTPLITAKDPAAILTAYSLNLLRLELYRLHGNDVDLRTRLSLDVPGPGLASYYRSHQDLGLPNSVVSSEKLLRTLRAMPSGTNKNDVYPMLETARSEGRLKAFPQNDIAFLQPGDTVILDGLSNTVRHIFDIHGDTIDFAPWSLKNARKGKPVVVTLSDRRRTTIGQLEAHHKIVCDEHAAKIMTLRRLRSEVARDLKAHTREAIFHPERTQANVDGMMAANRCLSAIEALLIDEIGGPIPVQDIPYKVRAPQCASEDAQPSTSNRDSGTSVPIGSRPRRGSPLKDARLRIGSVPDVDEGQYAVETHRPCSIAVRHPIQARMLAPVLNMMPKTEPIRRSGDQHGGK